LHWSRQAHDLLIFAFPFALIWFAGWSGPHLLRGGSWHPLTFGWRFLFGACSLSVLGIVAVALRRAWRKPPAVQISGRSELLDIAGRLGYRPIGHGPYELLARLPGNEVFRLEISEKEFRLPRLPAAWDGLSILHLSDLHFIGTIDRAYFEQVLELAQGLRPDLIVFTGDLLDDPRCAEWLPTTLGRLTAPLGRFFILGNHDWDLDAEQIRRQVEQLDWDCVASRALIREYRGHPLLIAGTERPWIGSQPDLSGMPPQAFRLLLSHTPDNITWARSHEFDLMLSGHNHGGQIKLPLFGPVYSPSIYGCHYADGVFWEPPTLLHVNRGLSGRHPLRWNCPPEITRIVLRAGT
jgi:hypothetical protein